MSDLDSLKTNVYDKNLYYNDNIEQDNDKNFNILSFLKDKFGDLGSWLDKRKFEKEMQDRLNYNFEKSLTKNIPEATEPKINVEEIRKSEIMALESQINDLQQRLNNLRSGKEKPLMPYEKF